MRYVHDKFTLQIHVTNSLILRTITSILSAFEEYKSILGSCKSVHHPQALEGCVVYFCQNFFALFGRRGGGVEFMALESNSKLSIFKNARSGAFVTHLV